MPYDSNIQQHCKSGSKAVFFLSFSCQNRCLITKSLQISVACLEQLKMEESPESDARLLPMS